MLLTRPAEHVWEKHFVTTFLGWLTFDPPDPDAPKPLTKKRKPSKGKGKVAKATGTTGAPTDAATFKKVFQTKGTLPAFSQRIPASVIANAVSSSAPKERVEEFMILEDKINTAKTVVCHNTENFNEFTLMASRCSLGLESMPTSKCR